MEEITFGIENVISRGIIRSTDNLSGFGVFAYYHNNGMYNDETSTPNYMYNVAVRKNVGDWMYAPLKYWPTKGTLSFFAYSPHTSDTEGALSVSGINQPGLPVLSYTVPDDITKQLDILTAVPIYESMDLNTKIHFDFQHALARISFEGILASTLPAGWNVKIKEIQVGSLANKATYSYDSWTIAINAETKSYNLSLTNGLLRNVMLGTTRQSVVMDHSDLFMLPQTVKGTERIKIVAVFDKNGTIEEQVFERPLADIITNLEEGKSYNVEMIVSPEINLTVECVVENWTIQNIYIPPFE
ncbi:hypothetical protein F050043D4_38810 [Bacteroides thetaiotaomicron]